MSEFCVFLDLGWILERISLFFLRTCRYQTKISNQLRRLGASFEWDRVAFTLSDVGFFFLAFSSPRAY